MEITDLLVHTQRNKASDLHLSTGNAPILRVNGEMVSYNSPPLTSDEIKRMLYSIMTEQQRSDYERDLEIDFAISFGENLRFRVNAFNTINGAAAVLRTIPAKVITLENLGAPEILKKLCHLHKGLILVTGPTGSGKSTTLAAMIDYINVNEGKHIITIEDPVEFIHSSKKSLINQREVGRSTQSFAKALRSALREDPDVVLVGEMRDIETIQLALTAAETGHLVMGTLHTSSAPKTIDRIIDVFPAHDKEMVRAMLSVSLEGIITQTLLRRKDGGRVAAHEIMLSTPAVRNLIRENKIPQLTSLIQMGSKLGMCTMKDSIYALLDKGLITEETARSHLVTSTSDESEEHKEIMKRGAQHGIGAAKSSPTANTNPKSSGNF
ncbi:MAG: type IV pilus twitching motility protein PilT [Alphaproteobacteria bacterium]|nr:type IV pilus twitching motility protein PilT [Alphaproteobacteria bacterium]